MVVDLLASKLSNESARDALEEQGADRRYTVAPSCRARLLELDRRDQRRGLHSGEARCGPPSWSAPRSLAELDGLQASKGVDPRYRIETQRVVAPDNAAAAGVRQAPGARRRVRDGRDPAVRGRSRRPRRWPPCERSGAKEGVPGQAGNEDSSDGAATNARRRTRVAERADQEGQIGRSWAEAPPWQIGRSSRERTGQASGTARNGQAKQGGTAGPERQRGARRAGTKT